MANPETDNHHVFFHRSNYKKSHERRFFNHHALVFRDVDYDVHRYLHRQLDATPPPKPRRDEMKELRELLDEASTYPHESPFWGAEVAMSYFVAVEVEHPEYAERAKETRLSLATQIGIFTVNYVPDTEEMRLFV